MAPATALDTEFVIRARTGERVVRVTEFFVGLMTTAVQPGEMLVEVRLPVLAPNSGWAFEEFSRRRGDFAIVGIAAMATNLPWQMSANLIGIPNQAKFVCQACCVKGRIQKCDNGCCITTNCPDHPSILIRDGKVVGTSA